MTVATYAEHLDYLRQMLRLKLWFLPRWLAAHPDEPFVDALRTRVDIYRKLDLNPGGINPSFLDWDDPRWQALEQAAAALYDQHRADPAAFEAAAYDLFEPQVEARAPRDYADLSRLDGYTYGSLRYDPPREGSPRVWLHIASTIRPRSLFADPAYLPACLRAVLRRAEAEHGASELGCGTWLNEHPAWLALFPAEWHANLLPPDEDVRWHYAFWGQFINARGAFNVRLAEQFRATGRLPYRPRIGWCGFAELRQHLAQLAPADHRSRP